ncbi:MAG: hypothetical protein LC121_11910, partial [Anaerolineae bacterium]|nr:hypothetical protein [Anaerolineae bacterium]
MKRVVWLTLVLMLPLFIYSAGAQHVSIEDGAPLQQANTQDDAPDWCVAVWYPSSEMPGGLDAIRANADLIGIVHPFWYAPLPDGTLETVDEDADLLAEWRALDMTIIPTIRAGFWQQIVDPAVRAFHVEQIVALVERMDYDGIDIDYE